MGNEKKYDVDSMFSQMKQIEENIEKFVTNFQYLSEQMINFRKIADDIRNMFNEIKKLDEDYLEKTSNISKLFQERKEKMLELEKVNDEIKDKTLNIEENFKQREEVKKQIEDKYMSMLSLMEEGFEIIDNTNIAGIKQEEKEIIDNDKDDKDSEDNKEKETFSFSSEGVNKKDDELLEDNLEEDNESEDYVEEDSLEEEENKEEENDEILEDNLEEEENELEDDELEENSEEESKKDIEKNVSVGGNVNADLDMTVDANAQIKSEGQLQGNLEVEMDTDQKVKTKLKSKAEIEDLDDNKPIEIDAEHYVQPEIKVNIDKVESTGDQVGTGSGATKIVSGDGVIFKEDNKSKRKKAKVKQEENNSEYINKMNSEIENVKKDEEVDFELDDDILEGLESIDGELSSLDENKEKKD